MWFYAVMAALSVTLSIIAALLCSRPEQLRALRPGLMGLSAVLVGGSVAALLPTVAGNERIVGAFAVLNFWGAAGVIVLASRRQRRESGETH